MASNSPQITIKQEPDLSDCFSTTLSTDNSNQPPDETCQRLKCAQDQETLRHLLQKSIYIDSMKAFLTKVKKYSADISPEEELKLLLLATSCIDLTTLSGDDTITNVERLCHRSIYALDRDSIPEYEKVSCAAVCVYPARVVDCVNTFKRLRVRDPSITNNVNIAAVATGFPSGQYGLKTRLDEVREAVENGANEIDVVINRPAAIAGDWSVVFEEICEMRKACDIRKEEGHHVHLKVILGAGDLLTSTPATIYAASQVAILAGADFIKTSTGKESVNATLPIGYIMMRCIAEYYSLTGIKIGFKPAGGIRTYKDALNWLVLVKMMLGPEWLDNKLFRFGASGLLDDVEKRIRVLVAARRSGVQVKSEK